MEFAELGDLFTVIRNQALKEKEVVHILHQILSGLHMMQKSNIIHTDLKTESILVFGIEKLDDGTSLYKVKIAGFSSARILDDDEHQNGIVRNYTFSSGQPNNDSPE